MPPFHPASEGRSAISDVQNLLVVNSTFHLDQRTNQRRSSIDGNYFLPYILPSLRTNQTFKESPTGYLLSTPGSSKVRPFPSTQPAPGLGLLITLNFKNGFRGTIKYFGSRECVSTSYPPLSKLSIHKTAGSGKTVLASVFLCLFFLPYSFCCGVQLDRY